MKIFEWIFIAIGRLAFWLSFPLLKFCLSRTRRVYVLLSQGGEVLLLKDWLSSGDWHLPGGGIKKNESVVQAASRELHEEIGLSVEVDKLKPLTEGTWQTRGVGNYYEILHINLPARPALKLRRPEILQAVWLKPTELDSAKTPAEILQAVAKLKL